VSRSNLKPQTTMATKSPADASGTGFDGILASIKKVATDISSLEVMTFRGKITQQINGESDWDQLMEAAGADGGELKLAMATLIDFDSDTRTFVADEVPPQWIIDVHTAAVTAGLEARRSMLELVTNSVKSLINPVAK